MVECNHYLLQADDKECKKLKISQHMLAPVQRIPRYRCPVSYNVLLCVTVCYCVSLYFTVSYCLTLSSVHLITVTNYNGVPFSI